MAGKSLPFWITAVLLALGALSAMAVLSYTTSIKLVDVATAVGSLFTGAAVLLAYRTLRATHEWNRMHYTIELMAHWANRARPHLAFLEHEFPEYFAIPDFIGDSQVVSSWRLDPDRARQLVAPDGPPQVGSKDLEIRDHLIELFNYFEDLCIAYEQDVLDRKTAVDSFAPTMMDAYTFFLPFIEEMRKANRRDPWPPMSRIVDVWIKDAKRRQAQSEAIQADARHKEALEKSADTWVKRTGV